MRKHCYRCVFLFTLSGREVIEEVWLSPRQLSAVLCYHRHLADLCRLPLSANPSSPCPHMPFVSHALPLRYTNVCFFLRGCRVCISPDRAAADSLFLCHAGVLTAWDSNQHLSPSQPGDSGGKSQVVSRVALQHANDLLQNFPRSTQQSFPLRPTPSPSFPSRCLALTWYWPT